MRLGRWTSLAALVLFCAGFAPPQKHWPNLFKMVDPGYPDGRCTVYGSAGPGNAKGESNKLKNRYRFPADGIATPLTWDELMALPVPDAANYRQATEKSVSLPDTKRYVSFSGYVLKAFPSTGGESCNCGAQTENLCDTHIEIVRDPNSTDDRSRRKVIIETTSRIRNLAKRGFIEALNIQDPNNWSSSNLQQMVNEWVTVKGWLFYDADHHLEDWKSDPDDRMTKFGTPVKPSHPVHNWRATCWEIHPVMSIEVLPGKPANL